MSSSPRDPRSKVDPHPPVLPATGFVRLKTVLEIIPISKSGWWAGVASGRFPPSVKLGPRTTAWRVESIRSLIDDLGADSNEMPARTK